MKSKLYTGVDWFKLFAAFLVVAVHSNLLFFKTIGRLAVPFFVIISSFFFFKKYLYLEDGAKKERLWNFEKRIFLLLFWWDILYLPLALNNLRYQISQEGGYNYVL